MTVHTLDHPIIALGRLCTWIQVYGFHQMSQCKPLTELVNPFTPRVMQTHSPHQSHIHVLLFNNIFFTWPSCLRWDLHNAARHTLLSHTVWFFNPNAICTSGLKSIHLHCALVSIMQSVQNFICIDHGMDDGFWQHRLFTLTRLNQPKPPRWWKCHLLQP